MGKKSSLPTSPLPLDPDKRGTGRSIPFQFKGEPKGEYFIDYDSSGWSELMKGHVFNVMRDRGNRPPKQFMRCTAAQLEPFIVLEPAKRLKGKRVMLAINDDQKPFTVGGKSRMLLTYEGEYSGEVAVCGQIRLADGSEHYAVLIIDEMSSGEHCGTGVFYDAGNGNLGIAWQDDGPDAFAAALNKTTSEVFPYKYKYAEGTVHCGDHHIDENTGWSL